MMNDKTIVTMAAPQKKYKSYKTIRNISTTLSYILLIILSIIWITPILWVIISSFVVSVDVDAFPVVIPISDNSFNESEDIDDVAVCLIEFLNVVKPVSPYSFSPYLVLLSIADIVLLNAIMNEFTAFSNES